jgi:hypothetical protein
MLTRDQQYELKIARWYKLSETNGVEIVICSTNRPA